MITKASPTPSNQAIQLKRQPPDKQEERIEATNKKQESVNSLNEEDEEENEKEKEKTMACQREIFLRKRHMTYGEEN